MVRTDLTVLIVGGRADEVDALRVTLAEAGYDTEAVATETDAAKRMAERGYAWAVRGGAQLGVVDKCGAGQPRRSQRSSPGAGKTGPVSEKRRLAAQLDRQIALLDGVTRNTETCLAFLGRDFEFVWVNFAFVEKLGLPAETLLGRGIFEVLTFPEARASFERVRDTLQPHQATETPLIQQNRQGVTYWNWTLTPVIDSGGALDGFDLSLSDVTALVNSRQEIEILRAALEQAYSREHHIADTLQRALIPEASFIVPGYHVAAKYQPALKEAEVGGDFYDVFGLSGGQTALVMGDVSGKGLHAAVYTAMAKYTIRAYAIQNSDPAYVLTRLNEVLYHYTPDDMFVTVFYGVLHHEGRILTYGSAGHDPPLVYNREADQIDSLTPTGCVSGIIHDYRYEADTLKLSPGDMLVVYTDGVTDSRSAGKLLGIDGLTRVLADSAKIGGHTLTEAIFEAALEAGDGALRDDAAVLVIRALEGEIAPETEPQAETPHFFED